MNWVKIVFSFNVSDVCSTTFLNKTTGNLFASIFFSNFSCSVAHSPTARYTDGSNNAFSVEKCVFAVAFVLFFVWLLVIFHSSLFRMTRGVFKRIVYRHQCRLTMLVYDSRRSKVNIHTKNVTVVYLLIDCCVRENAIRLTFFLQHGILPFQRQRNARKNPLVSRGKHSKQ